MNYFSVALAFDYSKINQFSVSIISDSLKVLRGSSKRHLDFENDISF
jgi:hypothetical protein